MKKKPKRKKKELPKQRKWTPSDYKPPNGGIDPELGYATHMSLNGGIWHP